jgi:hypothetical protein
MPGPQGEGLALDSLMSGVHLLAAEGRSRSDGFKRALGALDLTGMHQTSPPAMGECVVLVQTRLG